MLHLAASACVLGAPTTASSGSASLLIAPGPLTESIERKKQSWMTRRLTLR